jgi:hypothetical protein
MVKNKFNKRALEERSHLSFFFPQSGGRALRAFIPFLENCEVYESKRSNLAEYSLLARSNSLYAYLGAKSRSFNLRFNITFLHVLEHLSKEGLDDRFRRQFQLHFTDKESAKKAFFILTSTGIVQPPDTKLGRGLEHAKIHRDYYQKIANIKSQSPNFFDLGINEVLEFLGSPVQSEDQRYNEINKIIDLIIYWINLIRSTTNNNAKNSTLGPPIVRLTHGPMYNNIGCVVDSYNIRIVDEAGYDVQTLFPKRIEVTLTMNELKVGDFGDFKVDKFVDMDNNAGWEAIIESNNSDPYGGLISGRV